MVQETIDEVNMSATLKHGIDLTGKTYGNFHVIGLSKKKYKNYNHWYCQCLLCGNLKCYRADIIRSRKPKGCGCLTGENHKKTGTKTYKTWQCLKERCHNPNSTQYPLYGARGIKVCDRWRNSFYAFFEDMGERPKGKTIDRINGDGNYEPGNCRWATSLEQAHNIKHAGFSKSGSKYISSIVREYQEYRLGSFETEEEAKEAYAKAKRQYEIGEEITCLSSRLRKDLMSTEKQSLLENLVGVVITDNVKS